MHLPRRILRSCRRPPPAPLRVWQTHPESLRQFCALTPVRFNPTVGGVSTERARVTGRCGRGNALRLPPVSWRDRRMPYSARRTFAGRLWRTCRGRGSPIIAGALPARHRRHDLERERSLLAKGAAHPYGSHLEAASPAESTAGSDTMPATRSFVRRSMWW